MRKFIKGETVFVDRSMENTHFVRGSICLVSAALLLFKLALASSGISLVKFKPVKYGETSLYKLSQYSPV